MDGFKVVQHFVHTVLMGIEPSSTCGLSALEVFSLFFFSKTRLSSRGMQKYCLMNSIGSNNALNFNSANFFVVTAVLFRKTVAPSSGQR